MGFTKCDNRPYVNASTSTHDPPLTLNTYNNETCKCMGEHAIVTYEGMSNTTSIVRVAWILAQLDPFVSPTTVTPIQPHNAPLHARPTFSMGSQLSIDPACAHAQLRTTVQRVSKSSHCSPSFANKKNKYHLPHAPHAPALQRHTILSHPKRPFTVYCLFLSQAV